MPYMNISFFEFKKGKNFSMDNWWAISFCLNGKHLSHRVSKKTFNNFVKQFDLVETAPGSGIYHPKETIA